VIIGPLRIGHIRASVPIHQPLCSTDFFGVVLRAFINKREINSEHRHLIEHSPFEVRTLIFLSWSISLKSSTRSHRLSLRMPLMQRTKHNDAGRALLLRSIKVKLLFECAIDSTTHWWRNWKPRAASDNSRSAATLPLKMSLVLTENTFHVQNFPNWWEVDASSRKHPRAILKPSKSDILIHTHISHFFQTMRVKSWDLSCQLQPAEVKKVDILSSQAARNRSITKRKIPSRHFWLYRLRLLRPIHTFCFCHSKKIWARGVKVLGIFDSSSAHSNPTKPRSHVTGLKLNDKPTIRSNLCRRRNQIYQIESSCLWLGSFWIATLAEQAMKEAKSAGARRDLLHSWIPAMHQGLIFFFFFFFVFFFFFFFFCENQRQRDQSNKTYAAYFELRYDVGMTPFSKDYWIGERSSWSLQCP